LKVPLRPPVKVNRLFVALCEHSLWLDGQFAPIGDDDGLLPRYPRSRQFIGQYKPITTKIGDKEVTKYVRRRGEYFTMLRTERAILNLLVQHCQRKGVLDSKRTIRYVLMRVLPTFRKVLVHRNDLRNLTHLQYWYEGLAHSNRYGFVRGSNVTSLYHPLIRYGRVITQPEVEINVN
jgi:hypothetical protein